MIGNVQERIDKYKTFFFIRKTFLVDFTIVSNNYTQSIYQKYQMYFYFKNKYWKYKQFIQNQI